MAIDLTYPHIEKREGEPARLQRVPRVRVAQIVMDYLGHGWSAEEMCRQHPYLRPAEAHAALAYYYDHLEEVEQEIRAEVRQAEADKAAARPSLNDDSSNPGIPRILARIEEAAHAQVTRRR